MQGMRSRCQVQDALPIGSVLPRVLCVRRTCRRHSACTAESHAALRCGLCCKQSGCVARPSCIEKCLPREPSGHFVDGTCSQGRPQTLANSGAAQLERLPICRSRTSGAGAAPSTPTWWTRTPQNLMTTTLWPSPCKTSTFKSWAALPRSLAGLLAVCTHAPTSPRPAGVSCRAGVSCALPVHLYRLKQVPHAAAHDAAMH